MFTTDFQWEMLKPVLELPKPSRFGRPRADTRRVFEALLFVLHTGIQWEHLPRSFPPKSTVHDYLQRWSQSRAFRALLAKVVRQLVEAGRINLEECFVDATFAAAKSGGDAVGLSPKGKGTKMQVIVDGQGIPLALSVEASGVAEHDLVQQTLDLGAPAAQPQRLIGDKAYDVDELDATLAELGIEMIAPHRKNRRPENVTQDGRPLRRYRRRWKVERTIAWLGYHRRLLTRWEKHAAHFCAFATLGCLMIALPHLPFA
jgi:transposase